MPTVADQTTLLVSSQAFGDIIYTTDIPDSFKATLIPGAEVSVGCCPSGQLLIQTFRAQDFHFRHFTVLLTQTDILFFHSDRQTISLNISLQNSFFLTNLVSGDPLVFHEGQFNLSFFPGLHVAGSFQQG